MFVFDRMVMIAGCAYNLRLAQHTILHIKIRVIFVCVRTYAYVRMFGHPPMEISLLRAPK